MTAKEYLKQFYRLDQRIQFELEEVTKLHRLSQNISSNHLDQSINTNLSVFPSFDDCITKIMNLEKKINAEVIQLVELKNEIRTVIDKISDIDEQMVLRYRYLHNDTWEYIGDQMHADSRTVRRWHDKALSHVIVPQKYLQE